MKHKKEEQQQHLSNTNEFYGDLALANFDLLEALFADLRPIIDRARLYAKSDSPILIESGAGPELEMMAQSIHNLSARRKGPFIITTISGMTPEQQESTLFGNPRTGQRGAILDAHGGTLVIQGIDKLTLPLQAQLSRVIRSKRTLYALDLSKHRYVDVHFIASTSKNLTALRNQYLFRSDLLFTLKALRIRIPRLEERPNDIQNMLDYYLKFFNEKYQLQHTLSAGARAAILHEPWVGNLVQLQAFCERMLLTADERIISESYVMALFDELYHQDSGIFEQEKRGFTRAQDNELTQTKDTDGTDDIGTALDSADPYRELLLQCLRKNHGSRKRTAAELHISTSTLWRRLRQYQLL